MLIVFISQEQTQVKKNRESQDKISAI
jgi:hypothetical protein